MNLKRETNDTISPVHWFDKRTNVRIRLPFCPKNEFDSRKFIRKLNSYTGGKSKYFIVWQTPKIESLFKLKDQNQHPSHIVYKATSNNCDIQYIGETARNLEAREEEHEDVTEMSESARHIKSNPPSNCYALSALLYADEWWKRFKLQ